MNKNSFQNLVQGDYGRKIAYTSETKIDINNVRKVANIGIKVMNKNADAIRYLKAYELGDQPVLYRTKTARDDINNPIVENHAYELVQFEVGQSYGEPVQCVSLKNDERVNKNVDVLNDYYRGIDKQATDIEVGEWVSTVGHGYKAIIRKPNDEIPFRLISCDPDSTTIVYSKSTKEPLLAVQKFIDDEGKVTYMAWSDTYEYSFIPEGLNGDVLSETTMVTEKLHAFNGIPIVEYRNNSDCLSSIELVITILDGINELQSNRVDGVAQFVQSFIKFVNCDIDEETFRKMKDLGAIAVKSNNGENKADVDIISQELDQSQGQVLKNDLADNALQILAIPNREGNTGGDTQGAVSLRNGWDAAKLRAKTRDPFITKAEKSISKLVVNELRRKLVSFDLSPLDYDINIVHSPTDNLFVKAESLGILLEKGIHPLVAIRVCGLWSDAEKVYMESKPYLDVIYKTIDTVIEEQKLQGEVEKAKGILKENPLSQNPTFTQAPSPQKMTNQLKG